MNVINIEGIGPKYAGKLKTAGVRTTNALLKKGATRKGRRMLAESSKIDETLILEWVNLADLFRVKGVGEEFSDLLEEAGVDTVKELRTRTPANLYQKMIEVNTAKKLVRRTPSAKQVKNWVDQAKKLPPVVEY
jgi:predicted flap endonuclease-1-like 5' DNA nuclease